MGTNLRLYIDRPYSDITDEEFEPFATFDTIRHRAFYNLFREMEVHDLPESCYFVRMIYDDEPITETGDGGKLTYITAGEVKQAELLQSYNATLRRCSEELNLDCTFWIWNQMALHFIDALPPDTRVLLDWA